MITRLWINIGLSPICSIPTNCPIAIPGCGLSGLSGIATVFTLSQVDSDSSHNWYIPGIGNINAHNPVVRCSFKNEPILSFL